MRYSCAMMSPKVISPEEEEGADEDGAEWEEGAVESDCRNRNWASLRLMVA